MSDQEGRASDWLGIAKGCYDSSTDYFDANWRKSVERNISLFQSKHPSGSKYNSPQFKARSRLFRPKTKSVVRKNEAAAAAAFFANVDVVSVEPENDADPMQVASAEVNNELLNYRLTKTIPWFVTLLGALQEAQVVGVVASYQYWHYAEKVEKGHEAVTDEYGEPFVDEAGQPYVREVETVKVLKDQPCIDLIPIENIRFDPGASWTDIVGTSPYIIRKVPMYVDAVRQMMKATDHKTGQPKWKTYSEAEIRQSQVDYDTTRQKRNDGKQDPIADNDVSLKEFEIVWVHENFIRIDGEDVVYWTLGTLHMLTEPKPLEEVYFTGERPIVIGLTVLEAHKTMPDSLVAIGAELQKEVNETANQRRDNVSLVLNKRYIVKRNAQVDVDSLLRNVPGAVTMASDPVTDVQPVEFGDVTGSSYQEQDRLNVDFDDLVGNFSQGTVATNRNMNETVGGMKMLGGSASMMTEYLIRTFVETWVEPVLNQLVKLEQRYETDQTILALCGQKAAATLQKYGIDEVTDELLNQSLTVRVNVGVGATDPQQKVGKFMFAMKTYAEFMQMAPDAEPEAVRKELFGLLGYKDGSRFFKKGDTPPPQFMQEMQQMQEAMKQMQEQMQLQALQLKDKERENEIKAFDAGTKRMAVMQPDAPVAEQGPTGIDFAQVENDRIATLAEAELKSAQVGLTQAQTHKTLVDASLAPAALKAKQQAPAKERG